jgi:hypothetical protein
MAMFIPQAVPQLLFSTRHKIAGLPRA